MDKRYSGYCGLYCENCVVKARVDPAAKALYQEMKRAGFEELVETLPNGPEFWTFLKWMGENGTCPSCRDGGGNPGCTVRICAREKGVDMCAQCGHYPCPRFDELFACYPALDRDNTLLREQGFEAWAKLQDERRSCGFTYPDMRDDDELRGSGR